MNTLIVSNAATPRARRQVPALREALPEGPELEHRITETASELDALIGHGCWRPDALLVINGGDGSVQHALTLLARHCPEASWPTIACLPGGSTNMTAYDLNGVRRYRDCLHALTGVVRRDARLPVVPRPVVRVSAAGAPPATATCGLFFGVGTIVQGVEYFHSRVKGMLQAGGRHELAAGAALARALWGIARGQPPFDQPLSVRVDAPELGLRPGRCPAATPPLSLRLLFATTLDRLFLGMRPYWGSGTGAMKTTLVEADARRFLRRIPRLLRGRPDPDMNAESGFRSTRLDAMSLAFEGSYTLDGELFASPGDRMTVSASSPVRFLSL